LARAAGAQLGSTMKNIGKATANTVLNQPAAPAALPAPSVSPGMQIPKQKSKVAASPFNDDQRELDQYAKEEYNRDPDDINEESGAVIAHGYAYNRQDQRVAWTQEFASEDEAKEWARRRNATVLSIVPKPVNENNPAAAWPEFGKEQGLLESAAEVAIRKKNKETVMKSKTKHDVSEDIAKEDIITKLKQKLGDYLKDVKSEILKDPSLKDKVDAADIDRLGPSVKSITTDDGHEIRIHGNEDDGFRISIKNREGSTKFKNIDEATLACEMYCSRRRANLQNQDYMDEA
jgi:hypothetical protein